MTLTINGAEKEIPEETETITMLLHHLQLGNKKAVVERNGVILKKEQLDKEPVREGDKLEIVHFVGGG
ncbi:sulfur carrier protein ThiS [Salibacterium salarium]|uniref:Sulfur carrier protein ThiS n=1 Tax=Salibacterium salarium TaxID=284579 RepID=A0A3R9PE92_9BACI|nr:sulfur carrier protein ThiS [Salibacterium salarium]RSL28876.1 sulfur carrier protein ThiS [Salibacterium salarium]